MKPVFKNLINGIGCRLYPFLAVLMCLAPISSPARDKPPVFPPGMHFIRVEPGVFTMGSPGTESFRNENETLHPVKIFKAFYLQETEVTIRQWNTIMGKRRLIKPAGGDDSPMTRVSYYDCRRFIERVNDLYPGRYRLPTEAEWEYACRAGTATAFSTGDRIDCTQAVFGNSPARYADCLTVYKPLRIPPDGPAPVRTCPPNPWGFYDMHGNVWEWCADLFAPYLTRQEMDSLGVISAEARVRRGGSWFGPSHYLRSANRAHAHPGARLKTTGFRLVFEAD